MNTKYLTDREKKELKQTEAYLAELEEAKEVEAFLSKFPEDRRKAISVQLASTVLNDMKEDQDIDDMPTRRNKDYE